MTILVIFLLIFFTYYDINVMTFCKKIKYLLCGTTCKCGFLCYKKGCVIWKNVIYMMNLEI
jgi:hypothetical protein